MDVAVFEGDVDRAERVLLAEPQTTEAGDADLRPEEREAGHQRVGSLGAAQVVGSIGHGPHLTGPRAQAWVDVLRRRSMQNVGSPDLEAVERVDAAVEPAQALGELAHRGELAPQVLAAALGQERLAALFHDATAVLDPPTSSPVHRRWWGERGR